MDALLSVWNLLQKSLQQKISAVLMYVVESKGSSPGRQGFAMVVNEKGEMAGSIGGGIMEHKFVERAKKQLKKTTQFIKVDTKFIKNKNIIQQQIHSKKVSNNQSGMICSGEQTIFFYIVKQSDLSVINKIIKALKNNKNCKLELTNNSISFSYKLPSEDFYFILKGKQDFIYTEKLGFKNNLFIVGGGHCSLALSKLMNGLGFFIHLIDDRVALNTFYTNNFVHQKTIVSNYENIVDLIPPGKNNYVVIMTIGYRTDAIVLKTLLNKKLKYIGLLGSKEKIKKIMNDCVYEGGAKTQLANIFAPIGVAINSQTPTEIAISIAAEIIKIKNTTV